jgi:hypothetical protein
MQEPRIKNKEQQVKREDDLQLNQRIRHQGPLDHLVYSL